LKRGGPVRVVLGVLFLYGLLWAIASIPGTTGEGAPVRRWLPDGYPPVRKPAQGAKGPKLPRWLTGGSREEPLPGDAILPASLRPLADRLLRPKTREWKYVVVHHSASKNGNAATFDRLHRDKGWDGLGYHFVIGNGQGSGAGEIEIGARWLEQKHGAHAGAGAQEYNDHGVGICVVGDYEKGLFPEEAYCSLRDLAVWLSRAYDIPPALILPHELVRPDGTACPGRNFPLARLREDVRSARK
jgi:N-acetyl-anhydromuramyl-L-alanine amidase AmpD